jgi:hypothetical protein
MNSMGDTTINRWQQQQMYIPPKPVEPQAYLSHPSRWRNTLLGAAICAIWLAAVVWAVWTMLV